MTTLMFQTHKLRIFAGKKETHNWKLISMQFSKLHITGNAYLNLHLKIKACQIIHNELHSTLAMMNVVYVNKIM